MEKNIHNQHKLFQGLLLFSTLSILPWLAVEPINSIKFLFLLITGCYAAAIIFTNLNKIYFSSNSQKNLIVLVSFFTLGIVLPIFTSIGDWRQQLYGVLGRNIGILSYSAVIFIFIYILFLTDNRFDSVVIRALQFSGVASTTYGLLQYLNLDPVNWNNKYSTQIGFMGNPNFQSAFLGLYSIALIYFVFIQGKSGFIKLLLIVNLVLNLYLIVISASIQGIYVFCVGMIVLLLNFLYQSKWRFLTLPASISLTGFGVVIVCGFLQKGPMAGLYQPSISFRGDYWRAGVRMFMDYPLFGVGQSAFGDFYRAYRDEAALERRLDGTITNSAHNILIDLAAGGGILVLVPYLILIVYTVLLFFRTYARNYPANNNSILFLALWLGFLSQAVISVQFLPIVLWGWIFMAIILRQATSAIVDSSSTSNGRNVRKSKEQFYTVKNSPLIALISIVSGAAVGLLPVNASILEKTAYESQDLNLILKSANTELKDPRRILTIATILLKNGYKSQALTLAKEAVVLNEREYDAWNLISYLSPVGSKAKIEADAKMARLDPLRIEGK